VTFTKQKKEKVLIKNPDSHGATDNYVMSFIIKREIFYLGKQNGACFVESMFIIVH
jgi:hypothetical protein